ncbi:hypothetical protein EDD36DRAFT_413550 [Exophiala viscosa]|uniref:Uncharacterized protein n=1 Tax=Exophiala viscosa TaxID=2486360 RepID=A0AAN6E6Q5_9EURO|nr:hypothetical protein EDD36DRAFT_413550 [Exophiala viscosa]
MASSSPLSLTPAKVVFFTNPTAASLPARVQFVPTSLNVAQSLVTLLFPMVPVTAGSPPSRAKSTFLFTMAKKTWPKGMRDECRVTHALPQRLLFFLIIVFAPSSFLRMAPASLGSGVRAQLLDRRGFGCYHSSKTAAACLTAISPQGFPVAESTL